MIGIVDYGMGNLGSVTKAFRAIGCSSVISGDWNILRTASHLVLPGVGSFADGMKNLRAAGLVEPLTKAVKQQQVPVLGICLGLQLMGDVGFEGGETPGLGWVPGNIVRIQPDPLSKLKVPHVGWNDVELSAFSKLFDSVPARTMYFVHSYHLAAPPEWVSGTFEYGGRFTASVEHDNIFATQFHPEKSHQGGLALLRNFAKITSPVAEGIGH